MFIRLLIYFVLIFGTLFLEREYRLIQTAIRPDLFYIPIYAIAYLILFGLELRSKKSKTNYKGLKRTGFIFSFWVGVCWGIFITFMKGYPKVYGVADALTFALGCAIFGVLAGGIGILLTPLYLRHVFGEDQEESKG
jgi:hypothetical protein